MPFTPDTKTEMFTKSGRLCCLCLKQCGTNIEAAHIIDEHAGGPNDADNGIPVCFDCHQEIGGYDNKHPKGNKFRPEELINRRNRIYSLVESGVIFAQLVALNARTQSPSLDAIDVSTLESKQVISTDAQRFLDTILDESSRSNSANHKIGLLSGSARAQVLDELLRRALDTPKAISILANLIQAKSITKEQTTLMLEQLLRTVTLFGDLSQKANFLDEFQEDALLAIDETLRSAFFADLIEIINHDQYQEVNVIVPSIVNHQIDVPESLQASYVLALIDQAKSDSYRGAPSAKRALQGLRPEVAKRGFEKIDAYYLWSHSHHDYFQRFVKQFQQYADPNLLQLLTDYQSLSPKEFREKHVADD